MLFQPASGQASTTTHSTDDTTGDDKATPDDNIDGSVDWGSINSDADDTIATLGTSVAQANVDACVGDNDGGCTSSNDNKAVATDHGTTTPRRAPAVDGHNDGYPSQQTIGWMAQCCPVIAITDNSQPKGVDLELLRTLPTQLYPWYHKRGPLRPELCPRWCGSIGARPNPGHASYTCSTPTV